MAKFVFSDPHFDSESIIKNGNRPFKSVAEMNATLIKNYNATVGKQDICYWLGDIMYGATKAKVSNLLRHLRGRKYGQSRPRTFDHVVVILRFRSCV